jgi:hypothetical protein
MTRAYDCAIALVQDYADRLTLSQRIECEIALLGDPERAPLSMIAIAAQVIGERQ